MQKYQILRKSVHWEPRYFMRTDGWTDRHDEANSRLSQFCECAKNCCVAIYPSIHSPLYSRGSFKIRTRLQMKIIMFYYNVQHAKLSMSDNITKEIRSGSHWISDNFISLCAVSGLTRFAWTILFLIDSTNNWPPLWSSGQSFWRYQIFWLVVRLERGPLSLVRSIEELLE
jgi:hypothetical protein